MNPEETLDYLGHAPRGPEVCGITQSQRAFQQKVDQLAFLRKRQLGRTTRGLFSIQAALSFLAKGLSPSDQGTYGRANAFCHRRESHALSEQPDGPAATPFQLHRAS